MLAGFDFIPKYCPNCGSQISVKSIDIENAEKLPFVCGTCGLIYVISNREALLRLQIYQEASKKFKGNVELILSTKKSTSSKGLGTRVLFYGRYPEYVVEIPPDTSIESIREGLSELKTEAIQFARELGTKPNIPERIYFEYKRIKRQDGWSYRWISQQVLFDCLVCLFIHLDNSAKEEYKELGWSICRHLFSFMRKRKHDIDSILSNAVSQLAKGNIPWMPDSVLFDAKEAFDAWELRSTSKNIDLQETYPLAPFWALSIKEGYWDKVEKILEQNGYIFKAEDYYLRYCCVLEIRRMFGDQDL